MNSKQSSAMKFMIAYSASVALIVAALVVNAQDYDGGEGETSVSGLGGLSLGGLGGLSGLQALANGVAYQPMSAASESEDASNEDGDGERSSSGGDGNEGSNSDNEAADYEDDSNDSSASEEHPILSKFINLISGGRHKRSVEQIQAPSEQSKSLHRVKRHYKGWVPYVKTYVKTDKKAHFKWGVKAKVGKKYGK